MINSIIYNACCTLYRSDAQPFVAKYGLGTIVSHNDVIAEFVDKFLYCKVYIIIFHLSDVTC